MKFRIFFLSVIFSFLNYSYSFSQESEHQNDSAIDHELESKHDVQEEHHESNHKKHSIALVISHTHIKSGVKNDTGDNWMALPSFGLNYNYSFNEKLALGLHNDIIIEEFIVEDKNHSEEIHAKNEEVEIPGIERGRPIASAVILTYKPHKHIALIAGGGMEFSKHENFALIRFGVEFPFHIPNDWEILGVMAYDINIDAYDSFTFGIGIAKLF